MCVLVATENTDRYYDCYINGDASDKEWPVQKEEEELSQHLP
jgi:hypothetical protein